MTFNQPGASSFAIGLRAEVRTCQTRPARWTEIFCQWTRNVPPCLLRVALGFCRTRRAVRARWWCCLVYQIGAYSLSSSNNSKNASATILNCESSDFSPLRRGTEVHPRYIDWTTSLRQSGRLVELRDGESLGEKRSRPALFIAHLPSNPTQILTRAQDTKHWRT